MRDNSVDRAEATPYESPFSLACGDEHKVRNRGGCGERPRSARRKPRETYAGKLSHYFLAKFVDSVIVKLIKVNVLSVSLRAGGLRVPSYAGRNQIALFTAAGRREAVGR